MPRATHILSSLIACALLLIDGIGAPDLYAQEPPEDASIAEKVATSEVEDKALTLAVTECKERLHVALEPSRYAIEPVDASDIEVGPADISEASEAPEEADSSDSTDAEVSEEELLALEAALGEDAEQDAEDASSPPAASSPNAATQAGRILQSMNPDMALILDAAAAGFRGDPLQLGAHDPNSNGFNLQQLELHVESVVDPYFTFDANIVFAQFGVEVEEAYATTIALPANLQMRGGQFLTRMGRLNPTHPHSWHFVDQPVVNGKFFGGEGSRGLGAEASYLTPLPWFAEVIASATMADGACCARSFYGGQNLGVDGLGDLLYTLRFEQFFELSPSFFALVGASAQFGPNPSGAGNRTEIYGADLYLRWRPVNDPRRRSVSLQVEALQRRRQVPFGLLVDQGGYADLVAVLSQRFEVGGRYEFVSGIDPTDPAALQDPLDPDWVGNVHSGALQVTFYPSHFSRLRLQGSYDDRTWLDSPTIAAILALEVLVGAHGAHNF